MAAASVAAYIIEKLSRPPAALNSASQQDIRWHGIFRNGLPLAMLAVRLAFRIAICISLIGFLQAT